MKENEDQVKGLNSRLQAIRSEHMECRNEQLSLLCFDTASKVMDVENDDKENSIEESNPILRVLGDFTQEALHSQISLLTKKSALEIQSNADIRKHCIEKLKKDINILEIEREKYLNISVSLINFSLKGNVNLSILGEYRKKDIEYNSKLNDLNESTERRNSARRIYDDLRR